jgi:hypothetical protein
MAGQSASKDARERAYVPAMTTQTLMLLAYGATPVRRKER